MEEQAEVKLLGRWFSVFSARVEWALNDWSSRESNRWKLKKILPTRALCFLTPTQSTRESRFCFIMKNASRNHLLLLNTLMILGSTIHQYCLRILLRGLWHVSGLSSLMRRYIYIYIILYLLMMIISHPPSPFNFHCIFRHLPIG